MRLNSMMILYESEDPDSPAAQCRRLLEIAAPSTIPVLIQGETGCGKEIAARTLHHFAAVSSGPFIAVNCGAIPPALVESSLFGSVKGAYTGADKEQTGLIRAAHNGSLFLDEIGELPPEAQSRLLRTLQEKTVIPIGAHQEIPVRFRLICATHRDLWSMVQDHRFRADLYYRINAFPIRLPPLRERPADIPRIARQIWNSLYPVAAPALSEHDIQTLCLFPWPGNIRQLRNVLERWSLLMPHGTSLNEILLSEPRDLLSETEATKISAPARRARAPEIRVIRQSLLHHRENRTRAARALGISRGSLCYQLKKHAQRKDMIAAQAADIPISVFHDKRGGAHPETAG